MIASLPTILHSARPNLWLFIGLNAVTAGIVAGLDPVTALLFALCLSLLSSFGFIINDIMDRDIDRIIHPDRLAFADVGTLRFARLAVWSTLCLALSIAWFLGVNATLVALSLAISLGAYSLVFRKQLFVATLVCAYGVTSPVWAPFVVAGRFIPPYELAMVLVAFVIISARETISDLVDVEGDRLGARNTIATVMGGRMAVIVATILTGTGVLVLSVACIWRGLTLPLIGAIAIEACLVAVCYLVFWPTIRLVIGKQQSKQVLQTFVRQTRYAMALFPLFIIVDWVSRG